MKYNGKDKDLTCIPADRNEAGGLAFKKNIINEFVSLLFDSFLNEKMYEKEDEVITRLSNIIQNIDDKLFVAKAIIYTRKVLGMRSISHVASSILAKYISGESWAKDFYCNVINRPDDIAEIISYHFSRDQKLSNSMKKGFRKAFDNFNDYQIAKYKMNNHNIKLVDIINLVHPIPTEKNEESLKLLVNDNLKEFDTWEVEISAAGSDSLKKTKAWNKLIKEDKLGYMALVKNLRNILEYADNNSIELVCNYIENKNRIKKSLVLPFRFLSAYNQILKYENNLKNKNKILKSLNNAIEYSIENIPDFDGNTLVALDTSGSMVNNDDEKSPHKIGSLFSAILLKKLNSDFMMFSDDAKYINNIDLNIPTLSLANGMNFECGGTNFSSIFETANKKYNRIIILSDMESWNDNYFPQYAYNEYKNKFNKNIKLYLFDLAGYKTTPFKSKNIYGISGFSDKVFDYINLIEHDKNVIINDINKIKL